VWAAVPFHFWSLVFFTFGCITGSFLNVCIHRLPRGLSIVSPPSHCPHCAYSIPWYLNLPLITWVYLRGRCANCRAAISPRYFVVELLTGVLFLLSWLATGWQSAWLAVIYAGFFAGLIVATFIDFEHFIIPDVLTIGGMVAGFLCSLAVPALHGAADPKTALQRSALGILVGFGVVYAVVRLGKLMFGRFEVNLPPGAKVVFTETALVLPDQEISYDELFYRKSDTVRFAARTLEMVDRGYRAVEVRLSPDTLRIGDDAFNPATILHMEAVTDRMVLPREAMGFGDVKFMGAIGAFLGWPATLFCLMLSSMIGAFVGLGLIVLRRHEWSSRLPYGPYIALAAIVWVLGGRRWVEWWWAGGWSR
jgi:leader peptidase (prepilin peptidase)/N-methyltransferase